MTATRDTIEIDAVVVGAGFAGLYMLHRLRELGLSARVFEAGAGVGGTWYWNRYPGARCDVVSMEYSYQFSDELQQEWDWSERYASQPEILDYLNYVADRFVLRGDIQLNTRVDSAHFDQALKRWAIDTDQGDRLLAKFCIMASGCLSSTNTPNFKGIDSFQGNTYHTGKWPHEDVDFTDRRVGVIGTGSSAIQLIPIIAQQAANLYVFQRTPTYTVPAHNGPLDPELRRKIKAKYAAFRQHNSKEPGGADFRTNYALAVEATSAARQREYQARWDSGGLPFLGAYADLMFNAEANETAAEFVRSKIRGIVHDPEVAEKLCPNQPLGCKRLCVDTGYYETYNRTNVKLVDVSDTPIEEFTRTGLTTAAADYILDDIIFATGFDAMTGALLKIDVRGKGGLSLRDKWAAGPRTYLGLMTAGFPNFFIITGPGSPSVLSNMVVSIEQHVNFLAALIEHAGGRGHGLMEPTVEAEDSWVLHVNEIADATLFPRCNSWYLGANVPGKPRVFMPYFGFPQYVDKCNEIAANGYEGFVLAEDSNL
jgi:cation diffusion facilitator CzcD-associated flavoprotein CzcO